MMEMLVEWSRDPATAWWVVAVVGAIIGVEAVRVSRRALWGDMFGEEGDEE